MRSRLIRKRKSCRINLRKFRLSVFELSLKRKVKRQLQKLQEKQQEGK